jgi:hypothetical protein
MPKLKESKPTQELDTIIDNLTNDLLDSDLNYIIDKIQKWQRHRLRLKLAYKKRADNKKKKEAECKKIMEEQMRLMGLSEVKQSYSSEYNDTDEWIDFFIEKQSNMYYDNEKEVLDHFEEYVPHDF